VQDIKNYPEIFNFQNHLWQWSNWGI